MRLFISNVNLSCPENPHLLKKKEVEGWQKFNLIFAQFLFRFCNKHIYEKPLHTSSLRDNGRLSRSVYRAFCLRWIQFAKLPYLSQ